MTVAVSLWYLSALPIVWVVLEPLRQSSDRASIAIQCYYY